MTDPHSPHTPPSAAKRRLGSLAFVMGNAALFSHGLVDYLYGKDTAKADGLTRMGSASVAVVGGSLIAHYSNEPAPKQFTRLQQKLTSHLELSGAKLEEALRAEFQLGQPQGIGDKLQSFLYNHPTEVMSAYYGVGATGLIRSGIRQNNIGHTGLGSCIIASALVANLVPEKTPEQLVREGNNPDSLLGKIQQRPLRLANAISMGGNLISGYGAYREIKSGLDPNNPNAKHTLILGAISAFATASFIAGNYLVGTSSKKANGTPEEHQQAQQQLVDSAASILAAQPRELQKALAARAAEYLCTQPELRMSDADPAALTTQILEATTKAAQKLTAQGRGR